VCIIISRREREREEGWGKQQKATAPEQGINTGRSKDDPKG
jgi:hypothetical protein